MIELQYVIFAIHISCASYDIFIHPIIWFALHIWRGGMMNRCSIWVVETRQFWVHSDTTSADQLGITNVCH